MKLITSLLLIPMTDAPETGAISQLLFLVFRRQFFVLHATGMKISGAKINASKRFYNLFSALHCTEQTINILIYEPVYDVHMCSVS